MSDQLESLDGRDRFISAWVGLLATTRRVVEVLDVSARRPTIAPDDLVVDFALGLVALHEQAMRALADAVSDPTSEDVGQQAPRTAPPPTGTLLR